ncbi:MAG: hypothetical protein K8H85_00860 [Cyclobacteriaceae bacterium]|nr:hypothetical protein [Cyclobacteriaceae bacterium]
MRIKYLFLCLASCMLKLSIAQEAGDNQYQGTIVNLDGTESQGVIEANLQYPWVIQKHIRFFDASLLEQEDRVKLKDKPKLDAKDLLGFRFEDKVYESHKYADLSALGPKALGANYFFELVVDGPIKLYKFYDTPPTVMQGDPETIYAELRNNPHLFIKKGDEKIDVLSTSKLEKFISDSPEIWAKYNKGEYGNKLEDDGGKKSKLGKLINKAMNTPSIDAYVYNVINEYNTLMSSK